MRNTLTYLLLFFLVACKKENAFDCVKSNGPDAVQYRNTGAFRHVVVYDKIDVNLYQGNEYKVEVHAGANLLRNIETVNENGVLSIRNLNKCNFVRGYKKQITVHMTVPHIDRVENQGVGHIRFKDHFKQDSLLVLAENSGDTYVNGTIRRIKTGSHGNGDIHLNGVCDTLYVYMYGTNSLRGEQLDIKNYVFVETISIADAHIQAPDGGRLEYHIWRTGNIYYSGDPAVIRNVGDGTEKGKLIKK